jgi:hypothetical protein
MRDQGGYLESINEIPEPHTFTVQLRIGQGDYSAFFEEHEHAHVAANRDNNMRALWVILAVLALRPSLPVYPPTSDILGPGRYFAWANSGHCASAWTAGSFDEAIAIGAKLFLKTFGAPGSRIRMYEQGSQN